MCDCAVISSPRALMRLSEVKSLGAGWVRHLNKPEGGPILPKKYCIPLNVPLRNMSMYIVYSKRYYLHGINI